MTDAAQDAPAAPVPTVLVFKFDMPADANNAEAQAKFGRIMDEVAYHLSQDPQLPTATVAFLGVKDVAEAVVDVFTRDGASQHTSDGSRPKGARKL
jgi:hypothetical protein